MQDPQVVSRVKQEAQEAHANDIYGVPHFFIHLKGNKQNKASFSGAQPTEVFQNIFQKLQNQMKSSV